MSRCGRAKFIFKEIREAFRTKELFRTWIFFIIMGLIPQFKEYMYFYQIDVVGFSNSEYAYLQIFAFCGIFVGSFIYRMVSKCVELRTMVVISILMNLTGSLGQMFFCRGFYFGLKPFPYISIVMLSSEAVFFAFEVISAMTIFAKLIPPKIESSMFALVTGVLNLSYWFLARVLGNVVNRFFGVSKENLEDLWKLFLVQAIVAVIPLVFIWLLPNREEVAAVQLIINQKTEEENKDNENTGK